MKNFTFAIPGSGTPKSSGSASGVSRNLFSNEEDVAIVYENQVTPEQREAALKLQLPPNFYSYLNAPKCPGCPGCSDDEDEVKKFLKKIVFVGLNLFINESFFLVFLE